MKTNILYKLMMLLAVAMFTACSEDEGTDAGSDSTPVVTVYSYTPESPYNSDTDVRLRLAINSKVESVYYLAEKKADKESRLASLGENGYSDYVVKNGEKAIFANGELTADIILTSLLGMNVITVVAVNGNTMFSASTEFAGVEWVKVKNAKSQMNIFTGESIETELQYAELIDKYRIADPWGTGVSIVFSWDGEGSNVVFDSSSIATGWMHPSYGEVTFNPSSGNSGYFPQFDAFQFSGVWKVAAGSFGENAGVVYLHD